MKIIYFDIDNKINRCNYVILVSKYFTPVTLITQLLKIANQMRNTKCVMCYQLWTQCKGRFMGILVWNHKEKSICKWHKVFIDVGYVYKGNSTVGLGVTP
jgi:hypothetical protein